MAGYAAQLEQYQKAVDIYEQVGTGGAPSPALWEGAAPDVCTVLPPPAFYHMPPSITSLALILSLLAKPFSTHDPTRSHRPLPIRFSQGASGEAQGPGGNESLRPGVAGGS